jgi:RNA polymerase sigma-70 factor, ECF subfamily
LNSTPVDEHKFLELVNENRNRILRVCRVYAWHSADHDDLYQEIVFQIWRGLPALKEKQFANTSTFNTCCEACFATLAFLVWCAMGRTNV